MDIQKIPDKKILLLAPLFLLALGTGAKVYAWDEGGGFHYWHHWSYFHHWDGCGGIGDFNSYQGCCQPNDDGGPQTNSNQGTSINVINSPGATVNTYQSASTILQPIVHGLCQLTQVNCQGYGPQQGYQGP